MKLVSIIVGVVAAVGILVGVVFYDRNGTEAEHVEVVFGETDGMPDELEPGAAYRAAFVIGWTGPVTMRDGTVRVYASRRGDTTEDAPEDAWPLICEDELEDVATSNVRVACPVVAPGPGEFAIQLEVRVASGDVIGETLYTHLVLDPADVSS
jgi:hypothetical protein